MRKYRIGYERIDITPWESVPLAGAGDSSRRMSKCIRSRLYASCFAITDEADTTVILMTIDLQRADYETCGIVIPMISKMTGVPEDNILISGTHTHAGPDLFNKDHPAIKRYKEVLYQRLTHCAALAMTDRKEADVYIGQVEAERFNFTRHYWAVHKKTGERISVGDNHNDSWDVNGGITGHTTQSDPTVHIIKIVRDYCKDLVLVNFRAHGHLCTTGQHWEISSDWIDNLRTEFEKRTDSFLSYFQGASGNQNAYSRIHEEERTRDGMTYGRLLAAKILEGMEEMTLLEPALIKTKQVDLKIEFDYPDDERRELANRVNKYLAETGDRNGATEMALELGFFSHHHCYTVGHARRMDPSDEVLETYAVTLGDLAIVTAPSEMFDTLSMYVEEHAPFKKVLVFGYTNGITGYIPTKQAFEYHCYEVDCCLMKPGTSEQLADHFVDMLKELREEA